MDIVDFLKDKKIEDIAQKLSNRELEVLQALSRGNDVAAIAKLLRISRNTVKVYMANLSSKITIPTTKTNFRVAMCIFYNTFKQDLDTTCVDKGAASKSDLQTGSIKDRTRLEVTNKFESEAKNGRN